MDQLITAAAQALSAGDPLAALKRVALRDDPPALALRGIAMAQLGDLARARELLRSAARGFGPKEPLARARCALAEAEIALVSRDLGRSLQTLDAARTVLEASGDRRNAAHAGYLQARHLLLIGRLDDAERVLAAFDAAALPPASRVGRELVVAGIAIRRIETGPARNALDRARRAAEDARIPALAAEVDQAVRAFAAPAARLVSRGVGRLLDLEEVENLLASDMLVVDACRNVVRRGTKLVPLASRPVLLALMRPLAEAWPDDVARETLLRRAFGARHADETHRARLRVEIARLREAIRPLAALSATRDGFVLRPRADVAVLAPPVESDHGQVLALLGDGEAWSSSALALALSVSPRTVQRALEELAHDGKVEAFGRGRACRWIASSVPGFPTSLLLPATGISG
ncbi:helix-turn-helix domain-containing protein [Aminobacter sp. MDW-2]|uniref:helix-turn-helix domain-containing protein n=1 Tax=Aminobacter sp. MDW-2 TaxID=2666139 RepID=UPI0012AF1DD7|nr:helix-turn-helix domain-containing protein [Aminobacter sp. MDW-2]MRX37177.1 helix-turn-helix domain-containing protein [Aminobacter sp. MDW-2]QNH33274.1 helix-turn-helix domain-containing protein [Aminobacter sp. MDW-2]